jgi:hypothetical protein
MGMLHTASCIAQIHGIESGSLRVGLDGEEAMKQAALIGPVHPKMRSYNLLIAEIRALRSTLPSQVDFFWIRGHQQEQHGKEDYFGYLNNLCDNLAKAYWNQTSATSDSEGLWINYTTWGFGYDGVWPGQFSPSDLYDFTYGLTISIPYWQDDRHPMPPSDWIQVDWHIIGKETAMALKTSGSVFRHRPSDVLAERMVSRQVSTL